MGKQSGGESRADVRTDGARVVVRGELDMEALPALKEGLNDAVQAAEGCMIVDLQEVTFLDSLSLSAIIGARKRLGDDARVAIVATHPYVLLVLEATALDAVLDVFPTLEEAEAFVSSNNSARSTLT